MLIYRRTAVSLPCTESVPTCGDTCDRLLACGDHKCPRPCHHGECGPCRLLVQKVCLCGSSRKEMVCETEFICDKRCVTRSLPLAQERCQVQRTTRLWSAQMSKEVLQWLLSTMSRTLQSAPTVWEPQVCKLMSCWKLLSLR